MFNICDRKKFTGDQTTADPDVWKQMTDLSAKHQTYFTAGFFRWWKSLETTYPGEWTKVRKEWKTPDEAKLKDVTILISVAELEDVEEEFGKMDEVTKKIEARPGLEIEAMIGSMILVSGQAWSDQN